MNTHTDPAKAPPRVDHHVREFLKDLNSSGGQPIETLLRDEGEAYAAKLDEAGVEVTATRYGNRDPRLRSPECDQHRPGGAICHPAGRRRAEGAPRLTS